MASGVRHVAPGAVRFEDLPTATGGAPNDGVQLAQVTADGDHAFLLVRIAAGGRIGMHHDPVGSFCHVLQGSGTLHVDGEPDARFATGDVVAFARDVHHGWSADPEADVVLAVTVFPA
jgi:quercetin dioxygenase-like cupin family protein